MVPREKPGKPDSPGAHAGSQQPSETLDTDEQFRLGRLFWRYIVEAREIERLYLDRPHNVREVREAAAALQAVLDRAVAQAGGCAFGARPIPVRHIFAGFNDVQDGHYSKVLSPAQQRFGEQYDTRHRRMIIGYALAVWDVAVELGGKSPEVRDTIVDALNRAGFRVPVTRSRSTQTKTSGHVTRAAMEQWRKRARSDKREYAKNYRQARKSVDELVRQRLPSKPYSVEELIGHFEKLVDAHRIDD